MSTAAKKVPSKKCREVRATLPGVLIDAIRDVVGDRGLSDFLARAAAEKLGDPTLAEKLKSGRPVKNRRTKRLHLRVTESEMKELEAEYGSGGSGARDAMLRGVRDKARRKKKSKTNGRQ